MRMCHLHVYGAVTHCGLTLLCLCASVHVRQADQMLRCSLQGALISFVFTVTDGQQSDARPAAGQARMNGIAFKGQHPQGSHTSTTLLHTNMHLFVHKFFLIFLYIRMRERSLISNCQQECVRDRATY